MAERTLYPGGAAAERIAYQPISFLAILALLCSVAFVLVAVVGGAAAMMSGAPLLLHPAFLILPAAGCILSLLALRRIALSEGTMTGAAYARTALWLSVVAGAGYLVYQYATGLALQQQAHRFLTVIDDNEPLQTGFFPHLEEGTKEGINIAFLLTRPPHLRRGVRPDDDREMFLKFDRPGQRNPKGELSMFRESPFVYVMTTNGEKRISAMGVKNWTFEEGGYVVDRTYRLESPEMQLQFIVRVRSTESSSPGEKRQWHVVTRGSEVVRLVYMNLTPLGENIKRLREESREDFVRWCKRMSSGNLKKGDVPPKDATAWADLVLPPGESWHAIKEEVTSFMRGKPIRRNIIGEYSPEMVRWERTDDGKLRFRHLFMVSVTQSAASAKVKFYLEGEAVVESKEPVDLEDSQAKPTWRVVSYKAMTVRPRLLPQNPEEIIGTTPEENR